MKAIRSLWLALFLGLGGCQSPTNNAALTGLAAEYQELAAAKIGLDSGAGRHLTYPGTLEAQANADQLFEATAYAPTAEQATENKTPKKLLTVPAELPGAREPAIKLPRDNKDLESYLGKLYPALPPLEDALVIAPGPEGQPMALADLQRLASQYSPALRTAEAAVEAARGVLRQSTAYPNPTFAFQNDTLGTGPAGYPGFSVDQVIKTANKLQLQGAAATMDLFSAQLALRKARNDVAYQVRGNYFAVLVALENVHLSRVFARFTDEIYATQINLVKGKEAAAFEPMQLRPLALQARFNLIQAANQYRASWRQLVAGMGLPDMPPAELAGRVDLPVPAFDYQTVRDHLLNRHTDVLTAQNNIHKSEYLLKLAQVTPIPDVEVMALVQKDYTTPPFYTAPSVHVSVPVPVWDRNRGGIQQAQGNLQQAIHNLPVARNNLITMLADAFNRYETAKKQVAITLAQLKDQTRVYKHVYDKFHGGEPQVTFGDVVTAQQTLAGFLTSYVAALGLQWTAVVDVANLLQTDDLFENTTGSAREDAPPLREMETLFQERGVRSQEKCTGAPLLQEMEALSRPPAPRAPADQNVRARMLSPLVD